MNINIYNPYVRQELELYHHGILGQKWGKKNGPPYPLSASAHSASEKKAGWRKSLNGGGKTTKKKRSETEISLEKELKFLATAADNPKLYEKSYVIDRYIAFQKKIIDNSIDWYFDEPKSEAAKKWKSEKEKAIQKVENTLGKRFENLDKDYIKERNQLFDEYKDKPYKKLRKKLDQVDNIFNQRGLEKARNEYREAERLVRSKYKDKLVEVVLKDLGMPVTDENKYLIIQSQVLFWD